MFDYYIDLLKGVPKNHWGNAFIMQSDENLQKVLQDAQLIERAYIMTRSEAMDIALDKNYLNFESDFTDLDQQKIRNWVDEV